MAVHPGSLQPARGGHDLARNSTGYGGDGLRTGIGLRYRVSERVLFVENVQHWGLNKSLLTFGVQF